MSIGGCGGGHDDNLSGTQEGQDSGGTITSGDNLGGRGDGWENLAFDMFSGSWEVYDIYADVNHSTVLDHPSLAISRFKCIPHPTARGGNLEITTLDGRPIGQITFPFWNTEANVSLTDVVFLSGGTYESTNKNYLYSKNNEGDDYYELEGSLDSNGKLSLLLEYVYFRHYNNYNETLAGYKYVIQTVLHRIPDNTVEDITLVAGD